SKSDQSSFTPASFVTNSEDTRGLSLDTALDPKRAAVGADAQHDKFPKGIPETASLLRQDDPIDLGIIRRPSAQYLFEGFLKHFNCLVGLLDPQLYTFAYTRERSSLLFTMILSISSRIFQPESHRRIREHAELLLGRVLLSCDSAVENIWAIVCIYHWKDVDDTRGYTLIGFALRMAASAQWNMTRRSVSYHTQDPLNLHPTELGWRQRRDKDRVWLALGNIDRTSSYFTDRPLSATVVLEEVASRYWLSLTEWTYPLGDGKAVGGFELTNIARPVYAAMMKTRHDPASLSHYSVQDIRSFQRDMDDFNIKMTEWGEYWRSAFMTFPNPEPFQTPLIYLFQDYMRLYFNSVLLHRMLVTDNGVSFAADVPDKTRACYSSALSVLRQTTEMGKMDILYYLWDTAHLMVAYAAMMIPKLLKQVRNVSGGLTHEALDVLAEITTVYMMAAKSLESPDSSSQMSPNRLSVETAVSAQARLLSAILARLRTDVKEYEDGRSAQEIVDSLPTSVFPWIQDQSLHSNFPPGGERPEEAGLVGFPVSRFNHFQGNDPPMPDMTEDFGLVLDNDFINSRYIDVGLLSWDEPGIFIDPH
ncbi:hypothetical protein B0J13DRAFT_443973, partial [Dactylonectria estremocensis]